MKKLNILLILIVFCSFPLMAQQHLMGKKVYTDVPFIGLKVGTNYTWMNYSTSDLADATFNKKFRLIGGIFVEIPVYEGFSISPEIIYAERGSSQSYGTWDTTTVNYEIVARYIDLRVQLAYTFFRESVVSPYIFATPCLGYNFNGKLTWQESKYNTQTYTTDIVSDETLPMGRANMAALNFSAAVGGGLRFNIRIDKSMLVIKFDAAYSFGLSDTFSQMEHNGSAESQNSQAYLIDGYRKYSGIEAFVSIALPLINSSSSPLCRGWR